MSCQRNAGKITVPDELRDILLEFTISYLLEQPVNIVDYAVGFFTQLRESRQTQLIQAPAQTGSSTPDESVDEGKPAKIFIRDATSPSHRAFLAKRRGVASVRGEFERACRSCCFDSRNSISPVCVGNSTGVLVCDKRKEKKIYNSYRRTSMETEPPVARFASRRKSIFAETYNPEEDEEDDRCKMVHPKSDEQRQRLSDSVKHIFLFRALDEEQMADVLDALFEKTVQPGDFIIRQGDDGDNFYVIERGKFEVYVKDQGGVEPMIHVYDNRGAFGELALLYNVPRAATIKAITPGTLWAMDRQTFRRILLKSAYKKRKMYEDLINKVPMLKYLEQYERMNLADALVPKQYSNGEQIIRQGDSADGMYFVEDGVVRITIIGEHGREIEINKVPAGGYLGELALVTHKPRAASAYAVGDVKLAFLDVEAFERLLGPCMDLMKRNIDDYEDQLVKIFGSKANISDIR